MAAYGDKAHDKVHAALHEQKKGTLKSGASGKTVKSRKQAIAIGLSEARKEGGKVPSKSSSGSKKSSKSSASSHKSPSKSASRSHSKSSSSRSSHKSTKSH